MLSNDYPRAASGGAFPDKKAHITMGIQALSSAATQALSGIDRAISEVEQVAKNVADGGLADHPGESASQSVAAVTKLPELKQRALANAQVLNTAEELLSELTDQPRR